MDKLKNINFIGLLLALILLRSLADINISQSLVFIALTGFAGYMKWREDNKKISVTEEMQRDVEVLKTNVSGLMIKNASKPEAVKPKFNW